MKLEPLMTYHADLKAPVEVGSGPLGQRMIFDVTGGTFEGPRISGRLLASGADWLLTGADGFGRLDVRATMETHDGAYIYMRYHGILEMNETVIAASAKGESLDYGDTYFMTAPRFETGDARYGWINGLINVAEGRVLPNAVEYRVFQVANDS